MKQPQQAFVVNITRDAESDFGRAQAVSPRQDLVIHEMMSKFRDLEARLLNAELKNVHITEMKNEFEKMIRELEMAREQKKELEDYIKQLHDESKTKNAAAEAEMVEVKGQLAQSLKKIESLLEHQESLVLKAQKENEAANEVRKSRKLKINTHIKLRLSTYIRSITAKHNS